MSDQQSTSAGKQLRPSTAEREPYVDALAEAHADGRLDAEEYWARLGEIEEATTSGELDEVVKDVPFLLHEQRAQRAVRMSRRRTLGGLATLIAVGGGSFAVTRRWIGGREEVAARPPESPAPSSTNAGTPTSTPGGVPTSMVQVPVFDAETLPKAMDHCASIGIVEIANIAVWGERVQVAGRTADHSPRSVEYHIDRAPAVTDNNESGPWIEPAEVRDLDLADLVRRSRDIAELGGGDGDLRATIRHWPERWSIEIRGSSEEVYWDITGQNQLDH